MKLYIPDYHGPDPKRKRKRFWVFFDRFREKFWPAGEPKHRVFHDPLDDLEGDKSATVIGGCLMVLSVVSLLFWVVLFASTSESGGRDPDAGPEVTACCFFLPLFMFFIGLLLVRIGK